MAAEIYVAVERSGSEVRVTFVPALTDARLYELLKLLRATYDIDGMTAISHSRIPVLGTVLDGSMIGILLK